MERIEKLKLFLKDNPEDNFAEHALALEYIKSGEPLKARNLFEKILARDPAYVGSYYHLGKLLEHAGETTLALGWYQKGLQAAKRGGDQHAYLELKAAFENLEG